MFSKSKKLTKLSVVGGFCPLGRLGTYICNGEYEHVLGEVKPYISSVIIQYLLAAIDALVVPMYLFLLRKIVRKGDSRASGSGNILHDRAEHRSKMYKTNF